MTPAHAHLAFRAFALCVLVSAARADLDFDYDVSDEEYYRMPRLFALGEYRGCLARRSHYCVGSFDLHAPPGHQLFDVMKRYSTNWIDHYNHTRLHRGVCLEETCATTRPPSDWMDQATLREWFTHCINASMLSEYNISARLSSLQYCSNNEDLPPWSLLHRVSAAAAAAILALAVLATSLDLTLPDAYKKGRAAQWATLWSLKTSWQTLVAPPRPAGASGTDLSVLDGARVVCMLCVIIEHVCWLATLSYVSDTRFTEQKRREWDVMLLANSTLVVQIFFLMSSFLLAHKTLSDQQRTGKNAPFFSIFSTMFNRIIRISPAYWVVVVWAGWWWERAGTGPLWRVLVGTEAAICRRKWWTHVLYLNNVIYPDDKCLIQTWYLAADMQLYLLIAVLSLATCRLSSRAAAVLLSGLWLASVAPLAVLAWLWDLVPTFVMHSPEIVRTSYAGSVSFNVLYQSPLGNAAGALAGLLLARLHHAALRSGVELRERKWFRILCLVAFPLGFIWIGWSPRLGGLDGGGGGGLSRDAVLAALERPIFAALMCISFFGIMHGVTSPWSRVLSWPGWAPWSRLSFCALLLHMPLNKALLSTSLSPVQLDRPYAVLWWSGIASLSYMAALPLALLVEFPARRLWTALTTPSTHSATTKTELADYQAKTST